MNKVDSIVERLHRELQAAGSRFFLVYTAPRALSVDVDLKITSNSTQEGIRAILSLILRPTVKAIDLLAQEIAGSTRAGMDLKEAEIVQAVAEGRFREGAKLLFAQILPFFTISGWEDSALKGSAALKPASGAIVKLD